jgi:hypothetical protein
MRVFVAVLVSVVSGFGAYALLRWPSTMIRSMAQFDALMARAGFATYVIVAVVAVEVTRQLRKSANVLPLGHRLAVWSGAV